MTDEQKVFYKQQRKLADDFRQYYENVAKKHLVNDTLLSFYYDEAERYQQQVNWLDKLLGSVEK